MTQLRQQSFKRPKSDIFRNVLSLSFSSVLLSGLRPLASQTLDVYCRVQRTAPSVSAETKAAPPRHAPPADAVQFSLARSPCLSLFHSLFLSSMSECATSSAIMLSAETCLIFVLPSLSFAPPFQYSHSETDLNSLISARTQQVPATGSPTQNCL